MGFHALVGSTALDRAVARAGRAADARFAGRDRRARRSLAGGQLRELTADERAAATARVKSLFGGRVPVVGPMEFGPRS